MTKEKKKKSLFKKIILIILILILIPVLIIGGYLIYVIAQYHRVGNITLDINSKNESISEIKINTQLSVTSYNIGFGAYSTNYTFFMDEGYDKDGNKTVGQYAKGISYDDVLKNTKGSIEEISNLDSDFVLLQEVDQDSDRAYHINQKELFENNLSSYESTFAINFDTAYLFYPFNDPIGKTLAGLSTFSKYKINSAERKEYTISTGLSKFFDLDRCFSVHSINVENNKVLYLINSHMSAYDEGGVIRNKQLEELNNFIVEKYNEGNYVIVGGDFNHDLLTNNPLYPQYTSTNFAYKDQIDQLSPEWLSYLFNKDNKSLFDDNFTVYASDSNPSCRDCDVVWTPNSTFVSTVDGFVVSQNVSVNKVETKKVGNYGFKYSDHQPTTLYFELN